MAKWWTARRFTNMRTLWRAITRTIFWSYERGSWPYDLAVILIVLFVLLTPTHWFHDQPQASTAFGSKVQLQSGNSRDCKCSVCAVDTDGHNDCCRNDCFSRRSRKR